MRKQEEPYLTGNLTAMIDVVFQLIIFFVCAVAMQNAAIDDSLTLALAPNGTPVKDKKLNEFTIDVRANGKLYVQNQEWSPSLLSAIL